MQPGCISSENLSLRKFVCVLNLASSHQDMVGEWKWQFSVSLNE